ncbi:unnamed protein product [Phytophthora lilii]|uniref:Unnamed protein product n=1 Tax=Phytophthora lilii TaxID=2077276 RepID=A0A9W6TJH7_9STRA|nr:unnamed protein product [Phytophthora lilii]
MGMLGNLRLAVAFKLKVGERAGLHLLDDGGLGVLVVERHAVLMQPGEGPTLFHAELRLTLLDGVAREIRVHACLAELLHGVQGARDAHGKVVQTDGAQRYQQRQETHNGRHEQPPLVAPHGLDHLVGGVAWTQPRCEHGHLHAFEHARLDEGRTDHREVDAVLAQRAQLLPQMAHEPVRRELGGAVVHHVGEAEERPGAADAHDVPSVALDHVGQEGAHGPEVRERVDGERALDGRVRRREQRLAAHDAGVVDEDVDEAELLEHLASGPIHLAAVAHVHLEEVRFSASGETRDLANDLEAAGDVDVPDEHHGAELREADRQHAAEPHGAARDQHHLSRHRLLRPQPVERHRRRTRKCRRTDRHAYQ